MRYIADTENVATVRPETMERTGTRIDPSELAAPMIVEGYSTWRRQCGSRKFPLRAAISPRAISKLLRNTALIAVLNDGAEYEYRILGDAFVEAHGYALQGKCTADVEAISPGYGQALKKVFGRVYRTGRPLALQGWLEKSRAGERLLHYEAVYLPLGPLDNKVEFILGFVAFMPDVVL